MMLIVTISIVVLIAMLVQECRVEESKSKEVVEKINKIEPKDYISKLEIKSTIVDEMLEIALTEEDLCKLLEEYEDRITDQHYRLLRIAYGLDSSEGLNVDRLYTIQWICARLGFVVFKGDNVYYNPQFIKTVIAA